jgi:cyclic pyranopterin monophosphate synthase
MDLSHIDGAGKAKMVDVSHKPKVRRTAKAEGRIIMSPETVDLIKSNLIKKGDVLAVANIAGIQGAKRTPELIPLCHGIEVDHAGISFQWLDNGIYIESEAVCTDKTGIEMEALTAVSVAALTIYDMCKAVDKSMEITGIRLIEKTKEQI